ncbi:MAG: acyl carrier protein [Bacteroidia bacterium]
MTNPEKLTQAFATALNINKTLITDDLKYQGITQWDSVTHMILIAELESVFDIAITTDDIIDMSSFAKAKEIVKKYGIEL